MQLPTIYDRFFDMNDKHSSHLPNLRLIEYALALDQYRSFARAAQAMRVTQPTFSRGIAALERQFQVQLFVRSNRRVEPTPEGTVFLNRSAKLLEGVVQLRNDLEDYRNLHSGRIVIGVGPYPLDLSVIECVARLVQRHPQLQIELIEGQWREFGSRLISGAVDIAVVETSILAADPRFEVLMLPSHGGCFYCRRGHPLADRTDVGVEDILDYPIVGLRLPIRAFSTGKPPSHRLALDPATGDVVPHIATTSIAAARSIVERTDGIGIAAPVQLADDVHNGRLVLLDADNSHLRSGYGIVHLRDKMPSPGERAFIETLQEVEAELAAPESGRRRPKQGRITG